MGCRDPLFYGFHYDEYDALEKAGLFTYVEKVQGSAEFGAQDCIAAKLAFGDGIVIDDWKTFFPPSWSQEKVLEEVCRASKNIVEDLTRQQDYNNKYFCQGPSGVLIELVIDLSGKIISAYPSMRNFPGIKL